MLLEDLQVVLKVAEIRSITAAAMHLDLRMATDIKVYFCDSQSPWQRGPNENTNGLLRQYFP